MYKLLTNDPGPELGIIRINDSENTITIIPADPANSDWVAYQDWLAADPENQPLPADEE